MFTTTSWRPSGSRRPSASKIRSVPEGWSVRVITTEARAAPSASAIAAESAATATGPMSASSARSTTWAIIGRPAMSASGLFGRRVAASRAGMMTTGFIGKVGRADRWQKVSGGAAYTACWRLAKAIALTPRHRNHSRGEYFLPRSRGAFPPMDSFELNKIAGAVLFALLVSFGLGIASEMIFETDAPEAPGYMIAVAQSAEGHG